MASKKMNNQAAAMSDGSESDDGDELILNNNAPFESSQATQGQS